MSFQSYKVTLEDISSVTHNSEEIRAHRCFFNIPIYQRLYVWDAEQINTLLDDLYNEFSSEKADHNKFFYLGGILVVEQSAVHISRDKDYRLFDLIDGQQRFTTLWLLSVVFRNALDKFLLEEKNKVSYHRIRFAIRPRVTEYLEKLVNCGNPDFYPHAPTEARRLEDALAVLNTFKKRYFDSNGNSNRLNEFTRFIYSRVQIIFTIVPEKTDLNKLFEVINNRGVQLQHHEILKARILSHIDKTKKRNYGILWDACANMNEFLERNLKAASGINIVELFDNESARNNNEVLASARKVINKLSASEDSESIRFADILSGKQEWGERADLPSTSEFESDKVRSIISFPMLLMHTLRIWLLNRGQNDITKINEKELLQIFNASWLTGAVNHEDACSFIELLWEIRYIFDKYVIKWIDAEVETNEMPYHGIRYLRKSRDNYLPREQPENANRGFVLLQSMLYHSQQITTQYWLTPLLSYMHKTHPEHAADYYYDFLRHLDNYLFSSEASGSLLERSRVLVTEPFMTAELNCEILSKKLGLAFPHYWFYKMEFVLWYYRDRSNVNDRKNARWDSFTFKAKNSVEHISPQNPQDHDPDKVSGVNAHNILNCFGNLALVSRSVNSEYSNKPYRVKREQFLLKNAQSVDSLKMDIIYRNESWGDSEAISHQNEIIKLMQNYLTDTANTITDSTGEN